MSMNSMFEKPVQPAKEAVEEGYEEMEASREAISDKEQIELLLSERGYSCDVNFYNVTAWVPREGKFKNGEVIISEGASMEDVFELANEVHGEGGSLQAYLPDGKYLASYVGLYEDDGSPANGTGIAWNIK